MGRRIVSILFVGGILVALSCTGITRAELTCEQAVSKITTCCPEVDARRLPCIETEGGCASGEAIAVISQTAGECILDLECTQLQQSGKCQKLLEYALVPHAKKDRVAIQTEVCQ